MNYIRIQFDPLNLPQTGQAFSFADTINPLNDYAFEIVASLPAPLGGDVPIPELTTVFGAMSAFVNAFSNVYNQGLLYSVSINQVDNYVQITAINATSVFSEVTNTTAGAIVMSVDNSVLEDSITITDYVVSENATDPCNLYDITVTTDAQADSYAINLSPQQAVVTNPFTVTGLQREAINRMSVVLGTDSDFIRFRVPVLVVADFAVNIINTPFGSTVTVDYALNATTSPYPLLLVFEYSFDGGTTWNLSNSQSGLPPSDYTVLVRDNIGCQVSLPFTLIDYEGSANLVDYDPIAEISNVNPLGFKKVVAWDNCNTPKVVGNTLSHEERSQINARNFQQLFQTCDRIETQLKANYEEITARIVKCGDTITAGSPAVAGSSNLLLFSEQGDNAAWAKDDLIINIDTDGISEKLIATSFSSLHNISQVISKDVVAQNYTISVYVKPEEYSRCYLRLANGVLSGGVAGWMNLNTGAWTTQIAFGGWVYVSSSISAVDVDGFFRVSLTVTSDTEADIEAAFGLVNNSDEFSFIGDNSLTWGMLFKGMQLHQGDLTDYVQTTGAQIILPDTPAGDDIPAGVELNVVKKTNNMNNIDIRDGYIFSDLDVNSGSTFNMLSIAFGSGDTYDQTGAVDGSYNLGRFLPSWMNVGDYLFLEDFGWVYIDAIIAPSGSRDYYYVKTATILPTFMLLTRKTCTSYYNTVNYERHEFTIPENAFAEGFYQVVVNLTSGQEGFDDVSFLSEWINIQEEHCERHHIIDYYNSEGTDINYATGVRFRLRAKYLRDLKWSPSTEQDIYVTDTKSISIENRARDFYVMSLAPLPTMMAQKLVLALSQDKLRIDGETYILEGEIESTQLGSTNMYALKVTLSKSDYVFSSAGGLTSGEVILPSERPIEIDDNADGLLLI